MVNFTFARLGIHVPRWISREASEVSSFAEADTEVLRHQITMGLVSWDQPHLMSFIITIHKLTKKMQGHIAL